MKLVGTVRCAVRPDKSSRHRFVGPKPVMFSPNDFSDPVQQFGIARRESGGYGGGHARYPPHPAWKGKRITRPNFPAFANKKPNNSADFSFRPMCLSLLLALTLATGCAISDKSAVRDIEKRYVTTY